MPTREELAEIARKELARERARAVLLANKEIPFVRRMLNPQDYPALWSEEGVPRTVRLGSYGFDGTSWVVPEIAYQGGQLIEGDGGEWARGQIDRGNAIAFPNAALADEFARGEDSWKALFKSRGGDLIDDRIERPTPPDPIRLDAERDIGLYELALAAAQAGALGGAVGGAGVRAIPQRDAIRAAAAATSDELFSQAALERARSPGYRSRSMLTQMSPDDFLALSLPLPDGEGLQSKLDAIRGLIDRGVPLESIPQLNMAEGVDLTGTKHAQISGHEGRHRAATMKALGYETLPVELVSSRSTLRSPHPPLISWDQQADPSGSYYRDNLPDKIRPQGSRETRPAPYHTEGPLRGQALRTEGARRTMGRRIAGGLSRLGKAALNPVSILTDAAIGSVVGAGSALAGYEWSRPKSAGVFTAPGPGYEDALTQADILEIARGKELEKKARLDQYIKEALATGARIPVDARIEDVAHDLGPVR